MARQKLYLAPWLIETLRENRLINGYTEDQVDAWIEECFIPFEIIEENK